MSGLIKVRVQLPYPHDPVRGPGWTDLWIREGTSDEAVIEECFVQDVYRARGLTLAAGVVREAVPLNASPPMMGTVWIDGRGYIETPAPAPVIIDLGANIGCFTALMCAMYPDVHVVAVEPEPGNLELLRRNVEPFGERVTIVEAAVGCYNGLSKVIGAGATAHVGWSGQGTTPVVALNDMLAEAGRVALLKVDIEGAEWDTFLGNAGQPAADLAFVDRVAMEWHGPKMCDWLDEDVAALRYGRLCALLAQTHAIHPFGRPQEGGMLFATRYDLEG